MKYLHMLTFLAVNLPLTALAEIDPYREDLKIGLIHCNEYAVFIKENLFSNDPERKRRATTFIAKFHYWFDGFQTGLNQIRSKHIGGSVYPIADEQDVIAQFMLWCGETPNDRIQDVVFNYLSSDDEFSMNTRKPK